MPQRGFDIVIGPDGRVQVHIQGYKGKKCLEALQWFKAIVGEVEFQRETSEFYEPDEEVHIRNEQQT